MTLFGISTEVRPEEENAPASMVVRAEGNVTEVSAEQPSKALALMVVRSSGKAIPLSCVQLLKALRPMEAPSGMATEVRPE